MKLTINRPATLCLKSLVQATVPTINHRVRSLLGDLLEKSIVDGILTRVREVRILIRNDASATLRLIKMSPARDAEYRMLWAAQANKLTAEIAATIAKATKKFGSTISEDNLFLAEEVADWANPVQKPVGDLDFRLPDEKAAAAAAETPDAKVENEGEGSPLPSFTEEDEQEEEEFGDEREDDEAPAPVHGSVG